VCIAVKMVDPSKLNDHGTSPLRRMQHIEKSSAFAKGARFQRVTPKKKYTTTKESSSKVKDIDDATKILITPTQRKIFISQLRAAKDNSGSVSQHSRNSAVVNRRREYLTQRSSQDSIMNLYKTSNAGGSRALTRGKLKKAMERIDLDRSRKAEILLKEIMITHQHDSIANTGSGAHRDERGIAGKRDSNDENWESNNQIVTHQHDSIANTGSGGHRDERSITGKRDSNDENWESNNQIVTHQHGGIANTGSGGGHRNERSITGKRDSNDEKWESKNQVHYEKFESKNEIEWNVMKPFDDLIGIGDIPSEDARSDGGHAPSGDSVFVGKKVNSSKSDEIEWPHSLIHIYHALGGEEGTIHRDSNKSKTEDLEEREYSIESIESVERRSSNLKIEDIEEREGSLESIERRSSEPKIEDIEEQKDSLTLPLAVNNASVPGQVGARERPPSLTDQSLSCTKSSETVELARNIMAKKSESRSHGSFSNNSSTDYSRKYASFPPPLEATPPTRRPVIPRVPSKSKEGSEDFTNMAVAREIMKKRSFSLAERYKAFPPLQSESIGTSCSDSRQTYIHSAPKMKYNLGSKDSYMKSECTQLVDQGSAHRNESNESSSIAFAIASNTSSLPPVNVSKDRSEEHVQFNSIIHRSSSRKDSYEVEDSPGPTAENNGSVQSDNYSHSYNKDTVRQVQPTIESGETEFRMSSTISRLHDFSLSRESSSTFQDYNENVKEKRNRGDSYNKDSVCQVQPTMESVETESRIRSTMYRLRDFSLSQGSGSTFQDHNDHVKDKRNIGGLMNGSFDEEPLSEWKDPVLVAKVTDHLSSNGISSARAAIWDAGNGIEVDYNSFHSFSQLDKESGSHSESYSRTFTDSRTGTGTYSQSQTRTHSYSHDESHSYSQSTSMNDYSNSRSVNNRRSTKSIKETSSYDSNSCTSEEEEGKNFFACL
jgi:hypothetical protein